MCCQMQHLAPHLVASFSGNQSNKPVNQIKVVVSKTRTIKRPVRKLRVKLDRKFSYETVIEKRGAQVSEDLKNRNITWNTFALRDLRPSVAVKTYKSVNFIGLKMLRTFYEQKMRT